MAFPMVFLGFTMKFNGSLAGWWFQPLWKIWTSIGMMKFQIYGKIGQSCSKPPPISIYVGKFTIHGWSGTGVAQSKAKHQHALVPPQLFLPYRCQAQICRIRPAIPGPGGTVRPGTVTSELGLGLLGLLWGSTSVLAPYCDMINYYNVMPPR